MMYSGSRWGFDSKENPPNSVAGWKSSAREGARYALPIDARRSVLSGSVYAAPALGETADPNSE